MHLIIREKETGAVLADARDGQAQRVEGNWYVDPSAVRADHLSMTADAYTCPYKGTCHYADFRDGERRVDHIAWVYGEPKPGWEHIKGRYGFYGSKTSEEES